MSLRIGSLCTGYGGLDMAVTAALPSAETVWYAQYEPPGKNGKPDKNQWAAQILAHRWPGVPNHGDITRADWFEAEPVDILTAGYPCGPISFAGLGKVDQDARWIWPAVAQTIRLLRPRLVFLENVGAHLVRGFGTVAADLVRIGYVGSWLRLRASDVGAPHQRERLFIAARPADADTSDLGQAGRRPSRGRRSGPADGGVAAANPAGEGLEAGRQGRPGGGADFGPYAEAVRRWEAVLGRSAPAPTDERGRLAPPFVEWMMGVPAGWVTEVPGIPRSAQIHALGNGVVPQQGAAAFRILHERLKAVA